MTSINNQVWVVSGVLFNIASQVGVIAFSSTLLNGLDREDSSIRADLDMRSWLSSSIAISWVPGLLVSSVLMETHGRRFTFLLMIFVGMVGWLLMYFSKDVMTVLFARICGGMSMGATVSLGPVIIGEYTSPLHRGMFLNLKTVSTGIGSAITHALSHYFEWKTISLMILAPMALAFLNVLTWPESPQWLASKNRYDQCEKAFYWLRGDTPQSRKECEALVKAQRVRSIQTDVRTTCEKIGNFFFKFTHKTFLKPALIMCVAFLMLEVSGRHVFPAYALDFVKKLDSSSGRSFLYTMCMDFIIIGSTSVSCVLVRLIRRRTLLFFSGVVSLVILVSTAVYLYLVSTGVLPDDKPWIGITLFILYLLFVNLGCTPIPYTLLGEIYPVEHKAAGTALAGCMMALTLLVGLKTTPIMIDKIHLYGTFAVFALTMFLAMVYLMFALPETKNRTLQEIEDYFNNGKFPEKAKEEESKNMLECKV